MAIVAQDITSSPFSAGDYVNVRCIVNSITGVGSGGLVNLTVDTPGNVGERAGVIINVSPTQCRRSQGDTLFSVVPPVPPIPPIPPTPPVPPATFSSINAYGDSITFGFGLPSPSTQNWAAQFTALRGLSLLNNYAVSGARLCDNGEIPQAYANSAVLGIASIILPGGNDSPDYNTPSNRPQLVDGYRAFAVWLAIPISQKAVYTTGLTYIGSWTPVVAFGQNYEFSTTTGDTVAGTVVGSTIYIGGFTATSNTRNISVTVDGVVQSTITITNTLTGTAATSYPYCYRIAGLSAGVHTVKVTVLTGNTGAVAVGWMAGNGITSPGIFVGVGATLPYNNAPTSSFITALNLLSQTMCAELSSDGLSVEYIDDNTVLTLGPIDFQQTGTPNLHPTVFGAAIIANVWGVNF